MMTEFIFLSLGILSGAVFFLSFRATGKKALSLNSQSKRLLFAGFFFLLRYFILGGIAFLIMKFSKPGFLFFLAGVLAGNIFSRLIFLTKEARNGNTG